MPEIRTYQTAETVAYYAVDDAIETLSSAIESRGEAVWVLAGGSSPMIAYKKLASDHADDLDWSKVTVLIGDERMVSLDDNDSNWGAIAKIFDSNPQLSRVNRIIPDTSLLTEDAAINYGNAIEQAGIDHFDLVWVGVGEDGHTLSLFPGNSAFTNPSDQLIVSVFESPKPPAQRVSLSLSSMQKARKLVILAVGEAKREILRQVREGVKLPVAVVAETVEAHGGETLWLYDDAAMG